MKQTVVVALFCVSAALIAFLSTKRLRSQTVAFQSFLVMKEDSTVDVRSGASDKLRSFYGLRSDGSSVLGRMVGLREGGSDVTRHVTILPERKGHIVNDRVRAKSTFSLSPQQGHPTSVHAGLTGTCDLQGFVKAGEERVLGFKVIRLQQESAGSQTVTWAAPDLGCYALRTVSERRDAESHYRSEMIVTKVTTGEPPAELFRVPEDYTETTPSDLIRRIRRSRGLPDGPDLESRRRADEAYFRGRRQP